MLSICKSLFENWDKEKVRYCHWKSNEHLDEGIEGKTDLDVYVAPDDKQSCQAVLKSLSFIAFKPTKSSLYKDVEEYLGLDFATGKMIHVHLHYRIITGTKFCKEYEFPIGELMLSTRIIDEDTGVYVASPNLEIIVLYARIALKADRVSRIKVKDYANEIKYLKQRISAQIVKEYCEQLLGKKNGEILYSQLRIENIKEVNWKKVLQVSKKWLSPYKTLSSVTCWIRKNYFWARYFLDKAINNRGGRILNKKTLPGKGLMIAFIGQDGSGKSTVNKDVAKWLDWKVSNHSFYLGTGDGYRSPLKSFMRHVNHITPKKQTDTNDTTVVSESKLSFRRKVGIVLSCLNLKNASSAALKKVRQAYHYTQQGGIALFDRFPQLQFPGIYDGPKIKALYGNSRHLVWYIAALAKREERNIAKVQHYAPDLVFKLILPPEESHRRKPFENFEMIKKKSAITSELEFPNSVVVYIDACQDYQAELILIKKTIWEKMTNL